MFMLATDLSRLNSLNQIVHRRQADDFLYRRRILVAWICIGDDFIRARKADLLMPQAADHFEHTFFDRVVFSCFSALIYYMESKKVKRESLKKAPIVRKKWLQFNGYRYTYEELYRKQRYRKFLAISEDYRRLYGLKLAVRNRFQINVYHQIFARQIDLMQYEHWCKVKVAYYMESMKFNCRRLRGKRKMMWKATVRRNDTYWRRFFNAWQEFFTLEKNMSDIVYKEYLLKICRKIFAGFAQAVKEGKEYLAHVNASLSSAAARKVDEVDEDGQVD
jgi:hypothetical protein